ncbi:Transcriptional regulatory protein sin3 [Lecanora helva]
MNPQNSNGWASAPASGAPPSSNEHLSVQQRPSGNLGLSQPPTMHQALPPQTNGPSILTQSGPIFSSQTSGHNLPHPQNLPQAPPLQTVRGPPSLQQHSPPSMQPHGVQHLNYPLPNLGPGLQRQSSPQAFARAERERDYERERLREQQIRQDMLAQQRYEQENEILHQREQLQREQIQRDQAQHEQVQREHQQREQQQQQQQREQLPSPRENHTGTIPIQQPIASRVPATLHGPNGILNDQHPGVGATTTQTQLGAPSGPGNIHTNGVQAVNDNSLRSFPQQVTQSHPPQQLLGFSNAVTPQQLPNGVAALSQGQQPILNDALSYLDQVKVRFVQQPDVYNQFLDIMKDFKSQAIDTPGVIDRVSSLFAGHPELIQGFNTFLPPGYRIECGTPDDPNAIRVTTPMGTTVSQMPAVQNRVSSLPNGVSVMEHARQGIYPDGPQASAEWQAPQNDEDAPNNLLAHARRGGHPLFVGQDSTGNEGATTYEREDHGGVSQAALLAHQQEQRGVSNLSNAASAVATNGVQGRHIVGQVPPEGGPATPLGQVTAGLTSAGMLPGTQLLEKRGPVEFNHAIGYVNKIKNRFATQPEIYKQFLEILQTYQRESKPIQDVYAQVTQLFHSAQDLLEDFKQFLPESAAQAKAQAAAAKQATEDAAMLSNVRGDFATSIQPVQTHTPRPEMKMPPVGNFAPPSATKENKKRRGGPGSQVTGGAAAVDISAGPSGQSSRVGARTNANKRARIEQAKPTAPEAPLVSPTLVPNLPSPMPPSKDYSSISEQMAFFDRVKKLINDKKVFNEFLKLCNLFSQDLIDKNTLFHKAYNFIGSSADLTNFFRNFIKYDGQDIIIENKPKIPGDKVVLSNCRGLGPSYRLLPKRERLRPCGGRDELCRQVLNDEWVSHPTWASEDSGFIAHRKNTHEEALHRIEEERHDYDINIEACLRTIQLLEPIVQQLQMMNAAEKAAYVLPPGLGGQSATIYQRVVKKIYDREKGCLVIENMFRKPAAVLPVLLGRLKMKAEEWKAGQREWEKIWRDQTNKIFWKSLDHQGLAAKKEDKRQFQPKTLQTEIHVKYEEQNRQRLTTQKGQPKFQLEYEFKDMEVVSDACHLILTHLHYIHTNEVDKTRLETFLTTFIPTFFDLDRDAFQERMSDIDDSTPNDEEVEEDPEPEPVTGDDLSNGRGRKAVNGRKPNLLRGVLERGRPGQKEESIQDSKETTPDQSHEDDVPASTGTPSEHTPRVDETEYRWMSYPTNGGKINRDTPFKRDSFNLYASLNIYCFFRLFQMLYERLLNIKLNEEQVKDDVQRAKIHKSAHELNLIEKRPSDFFSDVSPSANYYHQVLTMCEDVIKQDEDISTLEETLRRFYMQKGWLLFSFDKMLSALLRFALLILVSDNKDKSLDIINLFYKDRKEDETTHQAELTYRKQVERLAKEANVYRIRYSRSTKQTQLTLLKKTDRTYETSELFAAARWSYYVTTYTMRDLTEGIPLSALRWPFMKHATARLLDHLAEARNARHDDGDGADRDDVDDDDAPQWNEDGLVIRIAQDNYHIIYDEGTCEWWVHSRGFRKKGLRGMEAVKRGRKRGFEHFFGDKGVLMTRREGEENLGKEDEEFRKWIRDGPPDAEKEGGANVKTDAGDEDEVMGGT